MDAGAPATTRTPAQRAGDRAEDAAAAALAAAGWRILGRRVRAGRSELDLVAIDPGPPPALVVVEVRWRGSRAFGLPEETVDGRKVARLRRGALPAAAAVLLLLAASSRHQRLRSTPMKSLAGFALVRPRANVL
jgi:putative endonuclease